VRAGHWSSEPSPRVEAPPHDGSDATEYDLGRAVSRGRLAAHGPGGLLAAEHTRRGSPPPNGKAFTGLLILGWGLYNLVEGIINHRMLGITSETSLPMSHYAIGSVLGDRRVGFILVGWSMA
jgi:hypothetical protein